MKNNIIYLPPFLIHEGFQQVVDFTEHFVLVKEENERSIYKHTVILDGSPHVDDKPILEKTFTDLQLSDFELKRNFVLDYAYHRGGSEDFIWSSVVTREEFLNLVDKRMFERHVVQTFNEMFPGRLVQELLDHQVQVTAHQYDLNKWWVQCPLPVKSSKFNHGSWINAVTNEWHCPKCSVHSHSIQPWIDNNRIKVNNK